MPLDDLTPASRKRRRSSRSAASREVEHALVEQTEVDITVPGPVLLASPHAAEFPGHVCRPTRSDVAICCCCKRSRSEPRHRRYPGLHHGDLASNGAVTSAGSQPPGPPPMTTST